MRTFVLFTILCACMVAWGADENVAQKMRLSFYELKLDTLRDVISPRWMSELSLGEPAMYRPGEFSLLDARRKLAAALFASEPRKTGMKMNMLGSIANTGYLNELPSDSVYQPAEEEGGQTENAQTARDAAKQQQDRANMTRSVVNGDQLGDAPSDEMYQGGGAAGSSTNSGSPLQQASEEAKKENAQNNMMGAVVNGGQWDDNGGVDQYQTTIQPTKKTVSAGEDRVPYLIKQLPANQNPNKNNSAIQRDIRHEAMKQQVVQPNPYDDL